MLTTKPLARHPHWNRTSQKKIYCLKLSKVYIKEVQNFIYTEYHSPQDLRIYQMFCSKNLSMGGWLANHLPTGQQLKQTSNPV